MTTELAGQVCELIDTGARPVTLGEIMARAHGPTLSFSPEPARPSVRLRWAAAAAAAVVTVGCAGAISAALLTAAGPAARHPAGRAAGKQGAVLTAARLRQVASASRAALAHSARAYVTYGGSTRYQAFQSGDIVFSGQNYSFTGSVVNAAASGRPGQVAWFSERIVNGQAYNRELDSSGWHWFHYTRAAVGPAMRILDPRALLGVLASGERFRLAGHVIVRGVKLERMAASDLAAVPGLGSVAGAVTGEYATALDVLVDANGVVHQVDISLRGTTLTAAASSRKPVAVKGPLPFAPAGLTNMTVTFADIGQPQTIVAPRDAINVSTPLGRSGSQLPPSLMPSVGAAGS